jgi:hypothetical protein
VHNFIRITRKRLPKSLRLGISIAAALAFVALFWVGTIGKSLFEQPDMERFLGLFFQEPLVLVVCVAVAWFVSLLNPTPSRLEEYSLLNSLPIPSRAIGDRFLSQDLRSHAWVPGLSIVLYFGLASVAPIPHLIRLGILTASCFVLIMVLNAVLHYRAALNKKDVKSFYPRQGYPLIHALTVVSYVICQLGFVIAPKLASGYLFWIVFSGLLLSSYASVTLVRALFAKWQAENLAFVRPSRESGVEKRAWLRSVNPFLAFSHVNVWLLKSLVKAKREKNVTSLALTVAFIGIAYLVSMNNQNAEDVVTVLFAIMGIYAFLIAFRATNQFAPEQESPNWIYSLPLRVAELYVSIFAPVFGWLCLVATSFSILIVLSDAGLLLAGSFWLKSVMTAVAMLSVACVYAVKSYPDIKKTQRQFLYWTLAGVILTAALYPYRLFVLGLMVLGPFLPFKRIHLHRVA